MSHSQYYTFLSYFQAYTFLDDSEEKGKGNDMIFSFLRNYDPCKVWLSEVALKNNQHTYH